VNATSVSGSGAAPLRAQGWVALPERLPEALIGHVVRAADALSVIRPRQDQLSGVHNPFGRAAALADAWKFLDLCESRDILDAVADLIGPDLVLWDSELYLDAATWEEARAREGRHWPADRLAGAFVDIALATAEAVMADITRAARLPAVAPGAHYVIRYMPATSLYNRDPVFPANRIAMEERPLVNYLNRPIWLVRGEDRAGSDFDAGFASPAPEWAADPMLRRMEV
jgi:hypothetical protein